MGMAGHRERAVLRVTVAESAEGAGQFLGRGNNGSAAAFVEARWRFG
jgi:hypothetical protein